MIRCNDCLNSKRFIIIAKPSIQIVVDNDENPVSVADQDIGDNYEVQEIVRCDECRSTNIDRTIAA